MLAGNLGPARMGALRAETGRMAIYLAEQLDAASRSSQAESSGSLLGILSQGVKEQKIDIAEAIGIAIVLFGAGGESTSALIGSSMRLLSSDAELRAQLRNSPDGIPRFVEETLRLEPPFKFQLPLGPSFVRTRRLPVRPRGPVDALVGFRAPIRNLLRVPR